MSAGVDERVDLTIQWGSGDFSIPLHLQSDICSCWYDPETKRMQIQTYTPGVHSIGFIDNVTKKEGLLSIEVKETAGE